MPVQLDLLRERLASISVRGLICPRSRQDCGTHRNPGSDRRRRRTIRPAIGTYSAGSRRSFGSGRVRQTCSLIGISFWLIACERDEPADLLFDKIAMAWTWRTPAHKNELF